MICNLTNLKRLFLHNNQLSGTLEENISDLISLDRFRIEFNYISGVISQNICNLDLQWTDPISFNISNNMFCEPYPFCVQGIQGYQDTLNCGSMKIFEENFKKAGAGIIECATEDSYQKKLLRYFRNR